MHTKRLESLQRDHPDLYFISANDPEGLEGYLRQRGLFVTGERLAMVLPAGDGNMNCTLRVKTNRQSVIVKQSRPWVEKYATIDAPWDRILSEARFYLLVSPEQTVAERMPKLLHLDADARIMVVEDLGVAADYTSLYGKNVLSTGEAATLATWLSELHAIKFQKSARQSLENRAMRELNHEHLFRVPLDPNNGLAVDQVTPGLSEAANQLCEDRAYVEAVHQLGKRYLADGPVLLHGDFFPGSWLEHPTGPRIIDPEFAHFGDPEFDLGVLLAHLYLARQPEPIHEAVVGTYRPPGGFNVRRALQYAGVEVMRRLIGVAQLGLQHDLRGKQTLLHLSRELVLSDDLLDSPRLLAGRQLRALPTGDDADTRCA